MDQEYSERLIPLNWVVNNFEVPGAFVDTFKPMNVQSKGLKSKGIIVKGDGMRADLIVRNARIFNVFLKTTAKADVAVLGDRFLYVGSALPEMEADASLDCDGRVIIPGLIDIHLHIESTMTTPLNFGRELAKHGVTTVVSEPHEIANVTGVEGIRAMIEAGEDSPIDIFYGIPSSVPSTSEELETTGGRIGIEEIKQLMAHPRVICLGEVMNFKDVISMRPTRSSEIVDFFRAAYPLAAVEGHCPSLTGLDLAKFLYRGIDSDHCLQTVERMVQRFENGMFVEIQEKSITPEIVAYLQSHDVDGLFSFVTDDVMPDKLLGQGHLDHLLRMSMSLGLSFEKAVYGATLSPAGRIGFRDRGAIAPGKLADFIVLDDERHLTINKVYKSGKPIYTRGEDRETVTGGKQFPSRFYSTVRLKPVAPSLFSIDVSPGTKSAACRIIEKNRENTYTGEGSAELPVSNGKLQWENSPFNLAAVLERYGKGGRIGFGLVGGATLRQGAVATTYAHDHHNLLVMGANPRDMAAAANFLIRAQGGIVIVINGEVTASLDLPVAGILSEESLEGIAEKLGSVTACLRGLGFDHPNPIMSLCTVTLPVSPEIKITDMGLVRVSRAEIVPLLL